MAQSGLPQPDGAGVEVVVAVVVVEVVVVIVVVVMLVVVVVVVVVQILHFFLQFAWVLTQASVVHEGSHSPAFFFSLHFTADQIFAHVVFVVVVDAVVVVFFFFLGSKQSHFCKYYKISQINIID